MNVFESDYRSRPEICSSDLRSMDTYADYLVYKENGLKSKSLDLGSIAHEIVLEDKHEYEVDEDIIEFLLINKNKSPRSTKLYKYFMLANELPVITRENLATILFLKFDMHDHEIWKTFNTPDREIEKEIYWNYNGYECKSKLDWFSEKKKLIIDLKFTERKLTDRELNNKAWDNAMQAAFYTQAIKNTYGFMPRFMWIFIELKEPYKILPRELGEEKYQYGLKKMNDILHKMDYEKELRRGYHEGIKEI